MEKSTFKYRIVKTIYRHRIMHEDGLGSLANVSSDERKEFGKEFTRNEKINAETYFGKGMRVFTQGGWISYSYTLELFNEVAQEWEYDGFIPTYEKDDEDD